MASEIEVDPSRLQSIRVAARPAFRGTYREDAGLNQSLDYVAIYVESPKNIYKVFLSSRSGDAASPQCRNDLNSALSSLKIVE